MKNVECRMQNAVVPRFPDLTIVVDAVSSGGRCLWGMAMNFSFWLFNAETRRDAEIRREVLFSAFLCDALGLCVKSGYGVAVALPRCVFLWVASLFRQVSVPLLVVALGLEVSAQISPASATNAAVKIASSGLCRVSELPGMP